MKVVKNKKVEGGLFITFEGIDGSGKTTQIQLLYNRLIELGYQVVLVKEPGGTSYGVEARELFLKHHKSLETISEVGLLLTCKVELLEKVIRPSLEQGKIVLCDRYTDSLYAYQKAGKGIAEDKIADLIRVFDAGLRPSATIYLDISVEQAQRRILERSNEKSELNSMDKMKFEFHQKVRDDYLTSIEKRTKRQYTSLDRPGTAFKIISLDATEAILTIAEKIFKEIKIQL